MSPVVQHLYLHFPVCARVCPYCAFYVHRGGTEVQSRLVQGLIWELKHARAQIHLTGLETIFFGGGTPSLIAPEPFLELAKELNFHHEKIEFTLEVNPATVTAEKARAWRVAGVNRISLGAQSFQPDELQMLGRQHEPEDISETFEVLREAGFFNISLDLMYGLPGQSLQAWENNLTAALACEPTHVSAYGLTYEEDTPFFEQLKKGHFRQDEATEITMFNLTRERFYAAGLYDYEVSNFAKPGYESSHNQAYWLGKDYLGLGPSAVSTIGAYRWKTVPNTEAYIELFQSSHGLADWLKLRTELEEINPEIRRKERLMFGLRMKQGIEESLVSQSNLESVKNLIQQGLLERSETYLRLTRLGQLVADTVARELI